MKKTVIYLLQPVHPEARQSSPAGDAHDSYHCSASEPIFTGGIRIIYSRGIRIVYLSERDSDRLDPLSCDERLRSFPTASQNRRC